ncbi:CapA family protein [Bacillus piscicola]|uniref:CapA family protein n=1 Tax=Bacillus piscicola TaxID=1632684 RepID=UPI001F09851B
MKLIATGDSFITRRVPENDPAFKELEEWIKKADAKFTNLETTVHRREGYPGAFSGGTWAMSEPEVLDDIQAYGFNLLNWATNHTLDYSHGGLEATEREMDKRGFIHAGAGKTLAAASEPRYLETAQGRVALIAATSTFHESWVAGQPTAHLSGRPGINPLRHEEVYHVTSSQLQTLQEIAGATFMNADEELAVKEGFVTKQEGDPFHFAGKAFIKDEKTYRTRRPLQEDLDRITASIRDAKSQADLVILSLHSHEIEGLDKNKPADFLIEAARACVDAGADVIFGHGPHVVRAVEMYKGKPIFYSLGNFIFQNETVSYLPADFLQKYGLDTDATVSEAMDIRSDYGKKGLGANRFVWESIVVELDWEKDKFTEISMSPIDLGYGQPRHKRGCPALTKEETVLRRLQELSAEFGTEIKIEQGKGYVKTGR